MTTVRLASIAEIQAWNVSTTVPAMSLLAFATVPRDLVDLIVHRLSADRCLVALGDQFATTMAPVLATTAGTVLTVICAKRIMPAKP